ncbi:MAG: helix-turn-helix domain-containing protein [Acidobacteria bacterium]|nr:helix-turn-helix domain-containing protein [Acidobacteriota bacterium]
MVVSKGTASNPETFDPAHPDSPTSEQPSVAPEVATTSTSERTNSGLIGTRLRARREASGISLRQFARDLDVSPSFISQLETGKAQPSVATLFAICEALGIATDELFDNETTPPRFAGNAVTRGGTDAVNNSWRSVTSFGTLSNPQRTPRSSDEAGSSSPLVHPNERKVLVLDSGVTWESLTATRNEKADFMFVRYEVGGSSTMEDRLIRHVGSEYGFILSGTLEITLGFENYRLTAGDSISFDSSRPHRLANVGDVPVEAIWMNLEFLPNH